MNAVEEDNKVNLSLSKQEALVFFEWLVRFNSVGRDDFYAHESEQQIMFDFEATLEKTLVEPFKENYVDLIKCAQESIFPSDTS